MDFKQLQYFVSVAENGSFTKASVALSIGQPVLSRHIQQLEEELRHHLFIRHGRGVNLTDSGEVLFRHVKEGMQHFEQARRELNSRHASPGGKLVIALSSILGGIVVPKLVKSFRSTFPDASLEIVEGKTRNIREWLLLGRVDAGMWHGECDAPEIQFISLGEKQFFLYSPSGSRVPKNKPIAFRDAAALPLILPSGQTTMRSTLEKLATKLGVELNVILSVEGGSLIRELIHDGYGHSILPKYADSFVRGLQLNRIIKPKLATSVSFAISPRCSLTKLAYGTAQILKSQLRHGI